MSDQSQEAQSNIDINENDLQAALRLLEAEKQDKPGDRRLEWANMLSFTTFALMVSFWPLGLIALISRDDFKWVFLIVALVATIIFFKISNSDLNTKANEIRDSIQGNALGKAMVTDWEKNSEGKAARLGCIAIVLGLIYLVGIIWFAFNAFLFEEINWLSVALTFFPALIVFVIAAKDSSEEYHYYFQAMQLQERLQNTNGEVISNVSLSIEELELLAYIENRQIEKKIAKGQEKLPQYMEEAYSVMILREPLEHLAKQGNEVRSSIRETIDALQTDPIPPNAQPIPNSDEFLITTSECEIRYKVDIERERVEVIEINTAAVKGDK